MIIQNKPLPKKRSAKCPYCMGKATHEARVGISRIGYYFPHCALESCTWNAKLDAKRIGHAHQEAKRQQTIAEIAREGITIRQRLIAKLGISLGWHSRTS